jgi:hypothetical protein
MSEQTHGNYCKDDSSWTLLNHAIVIYRQNVKGIYSRKSTS